MKAFVSSALFALLAVFASGSVLADSFVASYPDLATWAAAVTALQTDAPKEIEANLDAAAKCTENKLWRMQPTQ